ncbi:MAG: hypothetical protein IKO61_11800 [Lachnospiraceae bacterium]|nr:hypothetical protein [Lachnospiraceae bacterium]
MAEKKNKLCVLFPGRNYSCDKPLLYYAGRAFSLRGYEIINLDYNSVLKGDKEDIPSLIEQAWAYTREALKEIIFSDYEDVVFVSKSIGTAVAGKTAAEFYKRARHIYLTPVAEALVYMKRGTCLVVAGKEDKILEARKLKIYCAGEDIALKQFDDVGHSLEDFKDMSKTLAILTVIIRMYGEF